MTALLNYVPILFAILCYFLAGKFPADAGVHAGLLVLAGALAGAAIPRLGDALASSKPRDRQAGHGSPAIFFLTTFAGLAMAMGVLLTTPACHNVKSDQFLEATVNCAQVNPEASAALGAVTTCLVGAASGNPAACLAGLVTDVKFTVTEVACVVAWVADQENRKVAISAAGPASLEVRNRAIGWLVQERIAIRNTYPGAP